MVKINYMYSHLNFFNKLFICLYFAVLPVVVDIKVNLPDETHVILKVCSMSNNDCVIFFKIVNKIRKVRKK